MKQANPDVAAKLAEAVEDWKTNVFLGVAGKDDRPFPVGHREMPLTILPARDGVPHGNVRRSATAPNCSFFQGCTSTQDRITWDVELPPRTV